MNYKVKEGKESTFVFGVILGEASEEKLQEIYEKGDTRFIEKAPPPVAEEKEEKAPPPVVEKKTRKSSKKSKDKEPIAENE